MPHPQTVGIDPLDQVLMQLNFLMTDLVQLLEEIRHKIRSQGQLTPQPGGIRFTRAFKLLLDDLDLGFRVRSAQRIQINPVLLIQLLLCNPSVKTAGKIMRTIFTRQHMCNIFIKRVVKNMEVQLCL